MRQTHFFSVLAVFLVVCSVGCRMCGTQYDYCTPAYTGRTEDYRGCDPLYRAGSIFSYDNCGGNEISEINEIIDGEEQIIRATNAGNFGVTTPFGQSSSGSSRLEPRSGTSIGRPTLAPNPNGNYPNGNKNTDEPEDEPENENILPGIEDLLQKNTPVKPVIPTVNPPVTRQTSIETIPFTTQSGEPTFSIEDLRQLDPAVTDIKILNIEDAVNAQ